MYRETDDMRAKLNVVKNLSVLAGIVVIAVVMSGVFYTIEAGQRGVLLTFGKPDIEAKIEGLHFKIPLIQAVVKMNVKTQKYAADADASSKDLQMVSTQIAVNYHILPEKMPTIYKELGLSYSDNVIQPAVQEVVKASTAQFRAEELITKRETAKDNILVMLKERLQPRGIVVEDISITHFEFSKTFNEAIEAKVTAEQMALAAKNKLEQVKYEASQSIEKAKGEAEAIKIQAQAIQTQGGKDYVQLQAVLKWDGKLPHYVGGGGPIPFMNVTDISK
jgi:regulator of protease activity HflC (stomatin/prohibitin superfamily)